MHELKRPPASVPSPHQSETKETVIQPVLLFFKFVITRAASQGPLKRRNLASALDREISRLGAMSYLRHFPLNLVNKLDRKTSALSPLLFTEFAGHLLFSVPRKLRRELGIDFQR